MSEDGQDVVIHPGGTFFGTGAGCLQTLLGSCVAATFWHPRRRLGGMCHYVLPCRTGHHAPAVLDGRYGDEALRLLHQAMEAAGTHPRQYVVKLFGGGNMFPGADGEAEGGLVGTRNIETGRSLLSQLGFCLTSEHVSGSGYRVIRLALATGEVSVQFRSVKAARDGLCHG